MTHISSQYQGRFLSVVKRGAWEYVTRPNATGVVAIIALHDDDRVVLVEQYRPPVDASMIELPAGLVGDEADDETLLDAARRELEEEAGYTARQWARLATACSSPGMTDEKITFFLARGLTKTGPGGGVASESIRFHEVPWADLAEWLAKATRENRLTDMKLLAGLYAASTHTMGMTP